MWPIKNSRKKKIRVGGFTLIELIVASSILVLIGLAVLTAFGSGFHVYERVQSYGGPQADILLALEEMERSLRNAFFSPAIGFKGETQDISFPGTTEKIEVIDGEETAVETIGQVSYYIVESESGSTLVREWRPYSEAVSAAASKENRKVPLGAVTDMKFSYYALDGAAEEYLWQDSWSADENEAAAGLPSAVKIEITFNDGQKEIPWMRTVVIPSTYIVDPLAEMGEAE
ncbi:MAG TPA: type II secretion system protein GspJ, partial [Candidatus Omnitrophota bacterium]|nr:type II secretion system protein GspJ [Candidatus Omnitrophota bacterium]